ncbi:MAG: FtsQ-type POTRA domain-containing protein [Cyanosarcina radialis HA8281-LM2]|jgi:cell division protein FtsQ|nr:FtsQ-type POTRA domain-containing protein [Cyanosarcina radialis HA8281-LM2]
MANITSVSPTQINQRRRKLRTKRRIKVFQALWRSLLFSGIAGGIYWVSTLSDWTIRQPEQVEIQGNRLLSTANIRTLLPISYPQYLLEVQPQGIAQKLNAHPPIAEVSVNRQLWPPKLIIQVRERQPVAIAILHHSARSDRSSSSSPVGLLDLQGFWIPLNSYMTDKPAFELPKLKVIGFSDRYRPYWTQLYQDVSRSPVKVFEIDWRDPVNLVGQTELGKVYLGPYSSFRLPEQLAALDRLRKLPTHINPNQIDYIDLRNPNSPSVQLKEDKQNPDSDPR